jgi:hypothetical protein
MPISLNALRAKVAVLSTIHASLGYSAGSLMGNHVGWSSCQCPLAKLLRKHSEQIAKRLKIEVKVPGAGS